MLVGKHTNKNPHSVAVAVFNCGMPVEKHTAFILLENRQPKTARKVMRYTLQDSL